MGIYKSGVKNTEKDSSISFLCVFCAPGERTFYRVKVPRPPGSGKVIAKAKGVRREKESEGRRRQNSDPTNRNHVRL